MARRMRRKLDGPRVEFVRGELLNPKEVVVVVKVVIADMIAALADNTLLFVPIQAGVLCPLQMPLILHLFQGGFDIGMERLRRHVTRRLCEKTASMEEEVGIVALLNIVVCDMHALI